VKKKKKKRGEKMSKEKGGISGTSTPTLDRGLSTGSETSLPASITAAGRAKIEEVPDEGSD
jgi:hypothetical protein